MSSEENNESLAQQKTMEKIDAESLVNIDKQIDQAGRNSLQGELGRTLAMNKINEIKLALNEVKSNFEMEAAHAISDGTNEELAMFSLVQKKENVGKLEDKAK